MEPAEPTPLLTPAQMAAADAAAIASGIPGIQLMEAAGAAIAAEIRVRFARSPVHVLCGPGNNGGDGFIVARLLADAGWQVSVYLLGDRDRLTGDAALAAGRWTGKIRPLSQAQPEASALVVDAVFGAGLTRPVSGEAEIVLARAGASGATIIAVDVPSGLDGGTGQGSGPVCAADLTVTFAAPKPGHILFPGRGLCGQLVVADIGIPGDVLRSAGDAIWLNTPPLWRAGLPAPGRAGHKYTRGHCAVIGGGMTTSGASRLAAMGALRIGAGLVTLFSPPGALMVNAAHFNAVMVRSFKDLATLFEQITDARFKAIAVGPGLGTSEWHAEMLSEIVEFAHREAKTLVLDADAITLLAGMDQYELPPNCVLTPHEGEFKRLFPGLAGSKLDRARAAAQVAGAIVVLKGPDTVVAAPDGRAAINANAPPTLATAGSGDVLAGLIAGLACQGMEMFDAAAAAVWLHGVAASRHPGGLIADDLPALAGEALAQLLGPDKGGNPIEFRKDADLG